MFVGTVGAFGVLIAFDPARYYFTVVAVESGAASLVRAIGAIFVAIAFAKQRHSATIVAIEAQFQTGNLASF